MAQKADQVPDAACWPGGLRGEDYLYGTCCLPCVYGSGLAKDRHFKRSEGKNEPEDLCPNRPSEWAVIIGTCYVGSLVPCLTGVYLRSLSASSDGEDLLTAVVAEWCPLCSCAPCQMNVYRGLGARAQMLSEAQLL